MYPIEPLHLEDTVHVTTVTRLVESNPIEESEFSIRSFARAIANRLTGDMDAVLPEMVVDFG